MDKKEIKKRKRKRNRLIKSFVLIVAFVIAIGATFGVTMAYFGGVSGTAKYDMALKMGLYVGVPSATTGTTATRYVVPSEIVNANCEFRVKSAASSSATASASSEGSDIASNALIRAKIAFTNIDDSAIKDSTGTNAYFPVTLKGTTDTTVGNFVKHATDGYYYLVTGTSATDSSTMYVVQSSTGEQTLQFVLRVAIPSTLSNSDAGKQISLTVTYEVIEADFFSSSTTADAKTVKNAATIFNETVKQTDKDAGYTY